jgi:hypothetical protein
LSSALALPEISNGSRTIPYLANFMADSLGQLLETAAVL